MVVRSRTRIRGMKPSKEKPNGSEEEGEEEGNKEVELYEKSRRKPAFFIRKVKFDNAPAGLIADTPTGDVSADPFSR